MNKDLNALEKAIMENNDSQIIHSIKKGLRVSHLDVLSCAENIQNKNALYLLIKYGIAESEFDNIEQFLSKLTDVAGCSETLMIFQSDKFHESSPDPELKNAINEGNVEVIEKCLDRNAKITELDTITFSMALAGYTDEGVRWLFQKALTKKSRCYFLIRLVEEAKAFGESNAGKTISHYADILEDMLSAYTSEELEQAIQDVDRQGIIIRIVEGDSLSKPELLTSQKFFSDVSIHAAMFLFETGMTKAVKQQVIHLLQEKYKETQESWISEEIELLEDSLKPFPEELTEDEYMLENAIRKGDDQTVLKLVENDVRIRRPDAIVNLSFTKLSVKAMIAVATRALDFRVPSHIHKQISQIIAYSDLSEKEYDARIMVTNLLLQVAFGNMTWENSQDVTSLYPMDDETEDSDNESSTDNTCNESDVDDRSAKEHLWGYDNDTLQEKYNVEVVTVKCPKCGHSIDFPLFDFVNITEHPELKEKILNQEVFTLVCTECGEETIVPAPMLYRDDELHALINVCKSSEDAISYRFPVDDPQFREHFSKYELRAVAGCNGLCEKIRIFDAGLNELAVAYMKKRILDQTDDIRKAFFEKVDDESIYFILILKDAPMMSVHFPKNAYDGAVGFVNTANIGERLTSYFIDVNVFEDK